MLVNVCPGSARACGNEKTNGDAPRAWLPCHLKALGTGIRSRGGAGAVQYRFVARCGRTAYVQPEYRRPQTKKKQKARQLKGEAVVIYY